ncbi:MAG: hypothetical protein U9R34_01855 [Nanoarchaeota archaeon]|nr:hypothetical protein [Nanoarchaeota archaeon]
MVNIPNEEIETIFEHSYDAFKTMFSLGFRDKEALADFLKFVISTLESKENICPKLFSNESHGKPRFNNLNMSEQTLMATIFAEEKETAKQLMLFINNLKDLRDNSDDGIILGLIEDGRMILQRLGI